MCPVAELRRSLGPVGAASIGVASMVGAGVFYVFAPASALAGGWVLLALGIAGALALLNALSIAQLSLHYPATGGVYSFASRYLSPRAGFLAGWLFLVGKTASAAAIALVAARYLAPDYSGVLAALAIVVFAAVNISGIRATAAVSFAIAAVVVISLVVASGVSFASPAAEAASSTGGVGGVAAAAGLMFFAFAGYARMATLGGEVKNPTRVLPRVIVITLVAVLALYALVGYALLRVLGSDALALSSAPVADIAPEGVRGVVVAAAVLASLGSLMTVLAALSRVSFAMSREGDLPGVLSRVWERTSSPALAEATMALVAIVLVLTLDPVWLVGASSGSVLLYYAISHASALAQPAHERVLWRAVPVLGLLGCVGLVATLPLPSLITTAAALLVGLVIGELRRRRPSISS